MSELYQEFESSSEISALPMVAMLSGFSDSGSVIGQLSDHFFSSLKHELVVRFDNDELLDYRSRRPTLFFEKDHIESYEPATLAIYLVWDEAGQPFLLLDGYEPDMRWEAFARAVTQFCSDNDVQSFTWVHAIPFPIPHTRPTGITVSGNRQDMIARFSEWKPQTQVPGNVIHLLEFRLGEAGPRAALRGLELITAATGLVFPSDEIRERATKFDAKVDAQVEENAELAKLISTLEQGYANGDSGPARSPIGKPSQETPDADQIADDLEKYLATMQQKRKDEE